MQQTLVVGLLGLAMVATAPCRAQQPPEPVVKPDSSLLQVALIDGRLIDADTISSEPGGGFALRRAGQEVKVGAGDLLSVHGGAVVEAGLPSVWLAGGEVLRGAVVGGDRSGDTLELQSPVLDRLQVPVDRLLALTASATPRPDALRLPDGVDEALFRRARFGFDRIVGAVHEFGPRGVRFLSTGEKEPRWFALTDLIGLRIADPQPRAVAAPNELWTRTGDRLGVTVQRATGEQVECTLESGRQVSLRWRDIACLTWRASGTFVSDLEPQQVSESGFDGDVLYPWQRDRSTDGEALVAGGRTFGKGLGVHSRSRLTFVVPNGAARFWTRVAIDDTAAALLVRADVDVRVLLDGKIVFAKQGLGPGQSPLDSGPIAVRPGQALVLEVDFGKGRELGDRVGWLSPVFLPERSKKP